MKGIVNFWVAVAVVGLGVFAATSAYAQQPPHLGSPLAVDLLPTNPSEDPNSCVRGQLAAKNSVALQAANVGGSWVNGGTSDLQGDGQDTTGLSSILQSLRSNQSTQPFPMAYIAARATDANLAGLDCANLLCNSNLIRAACYLHGDPLASDLTRANWPTVFGGADNDAIVPLTSQLNGTSASTPTSSPFNGYVHSQGTEALDFLGPSELDSGPIPIQVVDLINESKSGPDFSVP